MDSAAGRSETRFWHQPLYLGVGYCRLCLKSEKSWCAKSGGHNTQFPVVAGHWSRFERSYFQRHDFESLDSDVALGMMEDLRRKLPTLVGAPLAGSTISVADDFNFTDPIDGSVATR